MRGRFHLPSILVSGSHYEFRNRPQEGPGPSRRSTQSGRPPQSATGQRFGNTNSVIEDPGKLVVSFEPCRVSDPFLTIVLGLAEE